MSNPTGWGGKRENSGRKKSEASRLAEAMKERIAKRLHTEGDKIIDVLLKKSVAGDIMAIRELFDRGYGKSTQAVEMEVEQRKMIVDDEPNEFVPSPVDVTELHAGVVHGEDE